MDQDRFPKTLLEQSIQKRIAYFESYTMAHPKLVQTAQQLMNCIEEPAGAPLVFIFGPSGVGKSTLLRRIEQKLLVKALPKTEKDKGHIPIAGVEAAAPEDSNFNWKDFYIRALGALNDPFVKTRSKQGFREYVASTRDTKLQLRLALEETIKQRHPSAFYIDEAQNLGKMTSGRRLKDQTDCIKSIANITNTQFIMVGTYELLLLRNLSAQLCRRSTDIHFSRYRAEFPQDLAVFKNIVHTFQTHLPLENEPNLVENWDFFYERSIGCVGILKDWLSRTLAAVLQKNADSKTLTLKDFDNHGWSLNQCMVMLAEAREEERQLASTTEREELRAALGLAPSKDTPPRPKSSKKKKRKAVGKPSPQRRRVGNAKDVV